MERQPLWQLRDEHGHVWPLVEGSHVIGRSPENAIVVDEPGVSRHHAELSVRDGGLWLRDLGSSNGTFVEGQRIREVPLRADEAVRLGQHSALWLQRTSNGPGSNDAALGRISGAGKEFFLRPGVWRVGRAAEAALTLEHPSVSRQHAELRVDQGGVELSDLGSSNGTFVNQRRVTCQRLYGGEHLRLGSVVLQYQRPGLAEAATRVDPSVAQLRPPFAAWPSPARPGSEVNPVPGVLPQSASGSGQSRVPGNKGTQATASGWLWGGLLLVLLFGGGAWFLYEQQEMQVSGPSSTASAQETGSRSSQERRQREQEALRQRAAVLARDPALDRRLAEIADQARKSGEIFGRVERAVGLVDEGISRARGLPFGEVALNRAGIGEVLNMLQGLSRDLSAVSGSVNGMGESVGRLRAGLRSFSDSGDERALRALGGPARDTLRQANALSGQVRGYRRQLEQGHGRILQVAGVADRVGMGGTAQLMRDAARPISSLSGYLQGIQNLIERDMQSFRLLEQAANTF